MDVTITAPGCEPVHTTTEAMARAAETLSERAEAETILETYMAALGML